MVRRIRRAGRKATGWVAPILLLAGGLLAGPGIARPPGLPVTAEVAATRVEPVASFALAIGPWGAADRWIRQLEGHLRMTAWQVAVPERGTLGLLQSIRAGLTAADWQVLFECETAGCGGFDFRFALDVLPEPAMHVDLGDFRYLAAQRTVSSDAADPAVEHIAVLVSRAAIADTGFVQIAEVSPEPAVMPDRIVAEPRSDSGYLPSPEEAIGLAFQLEQGTVVLDGVEFSSGAATTTSGGSGILAALAAYLVEHPERSIALVGHTDMSGSLEVNLALSERRARAVRDRMIREFGTNPAQITALGAGVMAPRASNLTPEGQARNRRVEAILTWTH